MRPLPGVVRPSSRLVAGEVHKHRPRRPTSLRQRRNQWQGDAHMTMRFAMTVAAAAVWLGGAVFVAQENPGQISGPEVWESCEEMHDSYVRRFESSPGFGRSR